jgi:hypothetical protein
VGASVGGDAVGLWRTHCRSQTLDRLASGWIPTTEGQCGRVASDPIRH